MGKTEKELQDEIGSFLGAHYPTVRVFRNNVGAYKKGKFFIKYGLVEGSSDLIGWQKLIITNAMVGMTFARFLAIELKTRKGKTRTAQSHFIDIVKQFGGISGIVRSTDDLDKLLRGE